MRKKILLASSPVLLAAAIKAEGADGPKFNLNLRSQMESHNTDVDGTSTKHTFFSIPYARISMKGETGVWDYRARFRLNKSADNSKNISGINKNVDYAYVGYSINKALRISFGQQFSLAGAFEYLDGSFSQLLFSEVYENLPIGYDTGVEFGLKFLGQWLGVQLVNGSTQTSEQASNELSVLGSYYGKFANGMIEPIISLGSYPRHRSTFKAGGITQKDDQVKTSHYAAGVRLNIAKLRIEGEMGSLETPEYTSYAKSDDKVSASKQTKKKIESYIFNSQFSVGKAEPFLKVVNDKSVIDTKSDSNTVSTSLGLFFKPDESDGRIHAAFIQSSEEGKDKTTGTKVKTKIKKFIVGYSIKV